MTEQRRGILSSYRFLLILLSGIVLGCLCGLVFGQKAAVVKPVGDIFLNLLFTVVIPLVFISIASAVANIAGLARLGRILGAMLLVFIVTGAIASALMLVAVKVVPPAKGVEVTLPEQEPDVKKPDAAAQIVSAFTVPDFPDLLSKRNMLPLIVFSILFGLAVALTGDTARPVANLLGALTEVIFRLVAMIMWLAPVGLGAYFAALVGTLGPDLLGSYARAMAVYYPMTFAYFLVAYTLYAWIAGGSEGLRRFWKFIITPAVTALGTGSSVATIPSNLAASARIGIPRDIREIVIPVGATIHMEGSCLSAILKIAFLFGVFNTPFDTPAAYATAIGVAILSGTVMAGIPGGGFVGELLIVTLYGFPPETLPILAVLGTLVDPPATMVNATGDTMTGMLVTRILEGKQWLQRPVEEEAELV